MTRGDFSSYVESIIAKSAFNLAGWEVVFITNSDLSCAEYRYRAWEALFCVRSLL